MQEYVEEEVEECMAGMLDAVEEALGSDPIGGNAVP